MSNRHHIPGIEQPPSLNPSLKRLARKEQNAEELVEGILRGDRFVLSRAITLLESTLPKHQAIAQQVIHECMPFAGNSFRVGITGVPGVGKSTFIESMGMHLLSQENPSTGKPRNLAVLAIDPSSSVNHGSILGDKTRMLELSVHPRAFIRPSAAGDSLGGVARKTREAIVLCEAAGYDTIFVETVGVGQSEHVVHSMTDCFLLLLLPGAGDELQGIKRGIVEMADLVAINKADGLNLEKARIARTEYRNALQLLPPKESQWVAQILTCSAISGEGLSEVWTMLEKFHLFSQQRGWLMENRRNQARHWLQESLQSQLLARFYANDEVKAQFPELELLVVNGAISPFEAAERLVSLLK